MPETIVRCPSAFNLGNMGAKAADAIPELEKLANIDPNPKVCENAREALDEIRGSADKATK